MTSPLSAPRPKRRIALDHARASYEQKMQTGRRAILVVACLLGLGAAVTYYLDVHPAAAQLAELEAMEPNFLYTAEDIRKAHEEVRQARLAGLVNAVATGVLTLAFVAFWFWAKAKPLAASTTALVVFVVAMLPGIVVTAMVFPMALVFRLPVILLITVVLAIGVSGARKARRLEREGLPAAGTR